MRFRHRRIFKVCGGVGFVEVYRSGKHGGRIGAGGKVKVDLEVDALSRTSGGFDRFTSVLAGEVQYQFRCNIRSSPGRSRTGFDTNNFYRLTCISSNFCKCKVWRTLNVAGCITAHLVGCCCCEICSIKVADK